MARSKKPVKNENKFQAAVDYLAEYAGVKGAAIADSEGLVVAKNGQGDFDAELYCAIALEMVTTLDSTLTKLMDPGIEHLSLKTAGNWLTVARSKPFCLVIAADKKATIDQKGLLFQPHVLVEGEVATTTHLPETRDARTDLQAVELPVLVLPHFLGEWGTRPDQAHVAPQYVD